MIRSLPGLPMQAFKVAVLVCVAVLCGACGSTNAVGSTTPGTAAPGTTPTGTTAPATAIPTAQVSRPTPPATLKAFCGVVAPGEIQTAINKPISVAFTPFGSTKGDVATMACGFGTSLTAAPVIEIEFSQTISGSTTDQFAAFKTAFVSTTPIPNLGDEAYVGVAPPDKNTETNIQLAVVVRQGNFFFFVGQFNDNNMATVVPADEKVAQLYAARL